MRNSATLPSIRPISDLRTRLNEVELEAKELREPIIMTKNGVASLVVMDSSAFEDMMQRERHITKLREAEIEEKYISHSYSANEVHSRAEKIIEAARLLYEND